MITHILKISILLLCFLIVYPITVYSESALRAGPPMFCAEQEEAIKFKQNYKETEFMVLQKSTTNNKPYFILYRNAKTGSWTFVAFNIPHAPPKFICLINGGLTSYLLPNIADIKKMIEKQNKGLDKAEEIKEDAI